MSVRGWQARGGPGALTRAMATMVAAAALIAGAAWPAPALAADPLAALKAGCATRQSADPPASRVSYRICTGRVASFDGTELDATLTLPAGADPADELPLLVFLHGFITTKGEYLSETAAGTGSDRGGEAYKTIRWNNVWFASRGYAVLNYTARGHGESDGEIGLASKHVEVRDTHHLTGLLADDVASPAPLVRVDPRRVGVLGGSYGGGQTWLLVTTRGDPSLQYGSWRSPGGRLLELAAAAPHFTWSDLLYSLVPNGHQLSSGVDPDTAHTPFGIGKQTVIDGFVVTAGTEFTPEVVRWLTRLNAGEPYDLSADPIVAEAKQALTEDRSPFYQRGYFEALRTGAQRRVPLLVGQGWTDPIFPAIEGVRIVRALREASPGYPVKLYLGDFEHLTALVKLPDLGRLHDLGNALLDRELRGRGPGIAFDAESALTNCDRERFGPLVRAPDFGSLAPEAMRFDLPGGKRTTYRTVDRRGPASDPVVVYQTGGRGCIVTDLPVAPGVASWTVPVSDELTMIGLPRLRLRFSTLAPDVELNSRLWDVAPDGTETLVTRGAYRALSPDPGGESATTELFGNAWRFEAGHRIRLEVTQDDGTYLRPDNVPSTVLIEEASLELPVTSAGDADAPSPAPTDGPTPEDPGDRDAEPRATPASDTTGRLPFTGFGLLAPTALGLALLAVGAALRRLAY